MLTKRSNETHIRVDKATRFDLEEYRDRYRLTSMDATLRRLMQNTEELRRIRKEAEA